MNALELSVSVIVRDQKGRVLLLRRARSSPEYPGKWEFPSGSLAAGESLDRAVRRCVRQQTGQQIKIVGSLETAHMKVDGRNVVSLVLEGTPTDDYVRLDHQHSKYKWLAPAAMENVDFVPAVRRTARRYAQDVLIHPRVETPKRRKSRDSEDLFAGRIVTPAYLIRELRRFESRQGTLARVARTLEQHLHEHIRRRWPMADVRARHKSLESYAAKLIKKEKYRDPFREVTDIVGARIVVHLESEVAGVCRWIESNFDIDPANSEDKLKLLGAEKFGYRSVHYVVVLQPKKISKAGFPKWVEGLKVEVQVRTIAQHDWADIGHDRIYKSDCGIPDYWRREANRIAALLEAVDQGFTRLIEGLEAYQAHSPLCPDQKTALRKLALWNTVRTEFRTDPSVPLRVVQLATELEKWSEVIRVAKEFGPSATSDLLSAQGYATCKSAKQPRKRSWQSGIKTLEKAAQADPFSLEPRLHLGDLLIEHDRRKALQWYAEAFDLDSANPPALAGYIRCKVLEERTTTFIPLLRPDIERAILRSRDLAAAGADIPESFYRIGGFLLLLGPEHGIEALKSLARAVHLTRFKGALVEALRDVSQLAKHLKGRMDIECARRFLCAALQASFPSSAWPAGVARATAKPLGNTGPIVILAGACDNRYGREVNAYRPLIEQAFQDFRGTIISGGTQQGISGMVGKVAKRSKGRIRALGYLPGVLPDDGSAVADQENFELRYTEGDRAFTALEPIQNWLDILASGIQPADVRVLGINGGNVAGLEYRLGVALGSRVGVIEGSGREAENVAKEWPAEAPPDSDRGWPVTAPGRLLVLPADAMTIRAFLLIDRQAPSPLSAQATETAAQAVHEDFLEQQRYSHPNPVMKPWLCLRDDLKRSNLSQIEYLVSMLRLAGFDVRRSHGVPNNPQFTESDIELLGEMEHGRWNVERLLSGWRHAPTKDAERKLSPYITSFHSLDPGVKGWDFKNVRLWPEILAEVGYEIFRQENVASKTSS